MSIDWVISTLERDADDGVVTAFWLAEKTDEEYMGSVCYNCSFTPAPSSAGYTNYADLTEQQVIGWVKDALGQDKISEIEADIDGQILASRSVISEGVPWK